jgi:hypothetical protein
MRRAAALVGACLALAGCGGKMAGTPESKLVVMAQIDSTFRTISTRTARSVMLANSDKFRAEDAVPEIAPRMRRIP